MRSKQCICSNEECNGISAAFSLLGDPRGIYTRVPKFRTGAVSYSDLKSNHLRESLLRHILPPGEICDDSYERKYIANHHYHPEIVLNNSKKRLPMHVRSQAVERLDMKLSDKDRIMDKDGSFTGYYFFVPNYGIAKAKQNLKMLTRMLKKIEEPSDDFPSTITVPAVGYSCSKQIVDDDEEEEVSKQDAVADTKDEEQILVGKDPTAVARHDQSKEQKPEHVNEEIQCPDSEGLDSSTAELTSVDKIRKKEVKSEPVQEESRCPEGQDASTAELTLVDSFDVDEELMQQDLVHVLAEKSSNAVLEDETEEKKHGRVAPEDSRAGQDTSTGIAKNSAWDPPLICSKQVVDDEEVSKQDAAEDTKYNEQVLVGKDPTAVVRQGQSKALKLEPVHEGIPSPDPEGLDSSTAKLTSLDSLLKEEVKSEPVQEESRCPEGQDASTAELSSVDSFEEREEMQQDLVHVLAEKGSNAVLEDATKAKKHGRVAPDDTRTGQDTSTGNVENSSWYPPLINKTICSSIVLDKLQRGWKPVLAVITDDFYMHLYDDPPSKFSTDQEEGEADVVASGEIQPTGVGLKTTTTPTDSFFLPQCTISTSPGNRRNFQVANGIVGRFRQATTRKLLMRTKSAKATAEWIGTLKMQVSEYHAEKVNEVSSEGTRVVSMNRRAIIAS